MPNSLNRLTSLLLLSGSLLFATGVLHAQEEAIFEDPNLRDAVRAHLGHAPEELLTLAEVEGILSFLA